jgi:hypothetical protein
VEMPCLKVFSRHTKDFFAPDDGPRYHHTTAQAFSIPMGSESHAPGLNISSAMIICGCRVWFISRQNESGLSGAKRRHAVAFAKRWQNVYEPIGRNNAVPDTKSMKAYNGFDFLDHGKVHERIQRRCDTCRVIVYPSTSHKLKVRLK